MHQCIQQAPLYWGQRGKPLAQAALQILKDQRYNGHVGDLVSRERFTNVFRPQSAQMHHSSTARKRHDEAAHEVDGVIGWNNTEVACARPKRPQRKNRGALLEIIFVRQHAAFRTAPGSGGVYDASGVLPFSRPKFGRPFAAKLLPSLRAREICARGSLRD